MLNAATRQYVRRFAVVMIVYTGLIVLRGVLLRTVSDDHPLRIVAALIPVIPIIIGFFVVMTYLRRLDEMQQRIQLEAIGFSLGMTAVITFALGLVEGEGIPTISLIWVLPMMSAFWGIGLFFAARRYR